MILFENSCNNENSFRFLAALSIFAIVFTGCASISSSPQNIGGIQREESENDVGWWQARFRWEWPLEEKPLWRLDYLAAHRIVAPVLKQFEPDIVLWRVHRRAARDNSGHQFSLIFYSSRKTACDIFESLGTNPLTKDLKNGGMLNNIVFDALDADSVPRPGIGDTSDKNWPLPVQNSWPYYIMGVSRMWMELIDQIAKERENPAVFAPEDLVEYYGKIEQTILKIWQDRGNHAFLHHLNAIFGYEPLFVYERRAMQF